MKQNETMLNTLSREELEDLLGEQHIGTSYNTPLRKDAFDLPDEEKMKLFPLILERLCLPWV
jgi:GTP cyclohydrolase I